MPSRCESSGGGGALRRASCASCARRSWIAAPQPATKRVLVDVGRAHVRPAAVPVREQRVAAAPPPLEHRDHLVHVGVDDALTPVLARLRDVVEDEHAVVAERDVPALERREPVAAVLLGVLLAADAEEAAVEQSHRAGENALARKTFASEVPCRSAADAGESPGELEHVVELLAVAAGAPPVVVAVLPPAGGVRADGLQVPVGVGADPDVCPRGRVASAPIRSSVARSVTRPPSGSRYSNPRPRPRRTMPAAEQSARRRRPTGAHFPRRHTENGAPRFSELRRG
jgi:hypothetical protein